MLEGLIGLFGGLGARQRKPRPPRRQRKPRASARASARETPGKKPPPKPDKPTPGTTLWGDPLGVVPKLGSAPPRPLRESDKDTTPREEYYNTYIARLTTAFQFTDDDLRWLQTSVGGRNAQYGIHDAPRAYNAAITKAKSFANAFSDAALARQKVGTTKPGPPKTELERVAARVVLGMKGHGVTGNIAAVFGAVGLESVGRYTPDDAAVLWWMLREKMTAEIVNIATDKTMTVINSLYNVVVEEGRQSAAGAGAAINEAYTFLDSAITASQDEGVKSFLLRQFGGRYGAIAAPFFKLALDEQIKQQEHIARQYPELAAQAREKIRFFKERAVQQKQDWTKFLAKAQGVSRTEPHRAVRPEMESLAKKAAHAAGGQEWLNYQLKAAYDDGVEELRRAGAQSLDPELTKNINDHLAKLDRLFVEHRDFPSDRGVREIKDYAKEAMRDINALLVIIKQKERTRYEPLEYAALYPGLWEATKKYGPIGVPSSFTPSPEPPPSDPEPTEPPSQFQPTEPPPQTQLLISCLGSPPRRRCFGLTGA